MAETFVEYRSRVLGYLADRDPIRVLRGTPSKLERIVKGKSRHSLGRRPATGKWSVIEILAHLADAELAMAWRLRNMFATPGVALPWWDENLWSQKLSYAKIDAARSLALFRALRESNLALLRSKPLSSWKSCYGVHDKRGRQAVADFVKMEAAHDLNHLEQIQRLLT